MKFYFVGIKGSGMAALAMTLEDDGHQVRGVDYQNEVFTQFDLEKRNIKIDTFESFDYDFKDVDYFIIGHNYIDSPFMEKVLVTKKPFLEYHKFIAQYFKDLFKIAICGTHGKTTTTGYFYQGLKDLLGVSMIRGDGTGVGGFQNNFLVFEACEYKEHFLVYKPNVVVVTNIDYDHVDYFKTKKQYNSAFNKFVHDAQKVIINYSDRNKIYHHHKITYGYDEKADYYYKDLDLSSGIKGKVYKKDKEIVKVDLPIFGKYNALHILSLVAFLDEYNFDINKALKNFYQIPCIKRRLEQKIIARDVFIDDYAHHPLEIKASLGTVKMMYPSKRIVAIFKPDRYSRLVEFKEEFKKTLLLFDKAYVLPLYEHTSENSILLNVKSRISYVYSLEELISSEINQENTVYLFMSSKNLDSWIYGLAKHKK